MDIATKIVTEAGGYISFDDYDKAFSNVFVPNLTLAGWGGQDQMQKNNGILYAQDAVNKGAIEKLGDGYELVPSKESDYNTP